MTWGRPAPAGAARTIARWTDAFNARDLERMLVCMHSNVDFHPLSIHGDNRTYRGHDDVREWFETLTRSGSELQIGELSVRQDDTGQVVAIGVLVRQNRSEPLPFCGLHVLKGGLIVVAHHYLSDPKSLLSAG